MKGYRQRQREPKKMAYFPAAVLQRAHIEGDEEGSDREAEWRERGPLAPYLSQAGMCFVFG